MESTKTGQSNQSTHSVRRDAQNLEIRYGKIGISAVAAAMRYQGDANSSIRLSADQSDRWLMQMVPEVAA
jgi:hypothetical protein